MLKKQPEKKKQEKETSIQRPGNLKLTIKLCKRCQKAFLKSETIVFPGNKSQAYPFKDRKLFSNQHQLSKI